MYPASFEYFAPATLDEALSILDQQGDAAKVMAGGQSLIPLMKLRFAAPERDRRPEPDPGLDDARRRGRRPADRGARPAQGLRAIRAAAGPLPPARRRGAADLGSARPQPRHRLRLARPRRSAGRLGRGDARGAAPRSASAARAEQRTIPIDDFFQGPFTTVLAPNEIVTDVRVPDPGPARRAVRT